jgi:hypothetical protein
MKTKFDKIFFLCRYVKVNVIKGFLRIPYVILSHGCHCNNQIEFFDHNRRRQFLINFKICCAQYTVTKSLRALISTKSGE